MKVRMTVEIDIPISNGIMEDEIENDFDKGVTKIQDEGIKRYNNQNVQVLLNWKMIKKELIEKNE
jgi:hypothetical protein